MSEYQKVSKSDLEKKQESPSATKEEKLEIQKQLADRMALRTWREDVSHAAQVASYFLDIDYKPAIALKFARINWQAAQTRSDARLLARAESAVATSSTLN